MSLIFGEVRNYYYICIKQISTIVDVYLQQLSNRQKCTFVDLQVVKNRTSTENNRCNYR